METAEPSMKEGVAHYTFNPKIEVGQTDLSNEQVEVGSWSRARRSQPVAHPLPTVFYHGKQLPQRRKLLH